MARRGAQAHKQNPISPSGYDPVGISNTEIMRWATMVVSGREKESDTIISGQTRLENPQS